MMTTQESIFEVQKILGMRVRHGNKEFLIHWRGFTAEEDSWEPENNLIGCQVLVKEFMQRTRTPSPGKKHRRSQVHAQTPEFKDDEGFTKLRTPRTRKSVGGKLGEEFKVLHLKSEAPQSPKITTSSLKVKSETVVHGKKKENGKEYQTEVAPKEEKPQEKKQRYHQVLLGWLMAIAMFVLLMLLLASFIPVVNKGSDQVNMVTSARA